MATNPLLKKKPAPKKAAAMKAPKKAEPKVGRAPKPTPKPKSTSSGTLTSRMADVKKSRGPFPVPAVRKETPVKKFEKPKTDVVKYKAPGRDVVKYEPKTDAGKGIAGAIVRGVGRGLGRVAGPAGALIAMTKPAGSPEESATVKRDRSYGPLMKGNGERKYGSKTGVIGGAGVTGTGDARNPTQLGANAKERRYFYGDSKPPIPKARPSDAKAGDKSNTRRAFEKEFAKNRAAGRKTFSFRGNSYSTKLAK